LLAENVPKIAVDTKLVIGMLCRPEIPGPVVRIVLVSIVDKKWQQPRWLARPVIQKSELQLESLPQNLNYANKKIVDMHCLI
jgi:hypothetical protein